MIIYSFFAHPDDCELWAGGTLTQHFNNGDEVKSFVFYDISNQRRKESSNALESLGISPFFHPQENSSLPDITLFLDEFSIEVPDVILTHWNFDSHIEHRNIFNFSTMLVHYWNRNQYKNRNGKYPILLMSSTYFMLGENKEFQPTIIIDITDVFDQKVKAIRMHKSQKPDLLIRDITSQNCLLGNRIGYKFAEGFTEYPLFGKNKSLKRQNFNDLI